MTYPGSPCLRRTDAGHGTRGRTALARAAALLAAAFCSAAFAQGAPGGAAIFLIAEPVITDATFGRSVVLVARHAQAVGPIGVIINRPTKIPVARAFPDAKGLAELEDKLYSGGPVAREAFFYVLRSSEPPPDTVQVAEGVYMGWNPQRLKALLERKNPMEGLRVYAGHSAWAPGQLEAEVSRGFWKSARADARSIFSANPDSLWSELMRRASATPVRLN